MTVETAVSTNNKNNGAIRLWLLSIVTLIFVMVIVGGATRLTNSGLSITEWKPILGAIPPLSDADWQDAFTKYKAIPEYKIENKGMSLAEFKYIYWWEWSHRFLGRFIGIAFFIPMLFFWVAGRLNGVLKAKLLALFVLGGLQGALGWYMVQSGLVDRVDVSQYRLAAHLGLAILIMMAVYWVYLDLQERSKGEIEPQSLRVKLSAAGLIGALFVQIVLGALVAGIHAGKSHNTWPLMDGQVIPDGLFVMSPWYLNFFENAMTVQFDHRILAYVIFFWAGLQVYLVASRLGEGRHLRSSALLMLAILAQVGLGIWTLLMSVPTSLGLAHQAGALIVLIVGLTHLHSLVNPEKGLR